MNEIPQDAAEAVYAIMLVEFGTPPTTVYEVTTGGRGYQALGRELEAQGIALTDPFKGQRGRDYATKVGVFVSPKTIGLTLLKGHSRFNCGNLADYLRILPGAERTSRTLNGKLTNGLLLPIKVWLDAFDQIDEQVNAANAAK